MTTPAVNGFETFLCKNAQHAEKTLRARLRAAQTSPAAHHPVPTRPPRPTNAPATIPFATPTKTAKYSEKKPFPVSSRSQIPEPRSHLLVTASRPHSNHNAKKTHSNGSTIHIYRYICHLNHPRFAKTSRSSRPFAGSIHCPTPARSSHKPHPVIVNCFPLVSRADSNRKGHYAPTKVVWKEARSC